MIYKDVTKSFAFFNPFHLPNLLDLLSQKEKKIDFTLIDNNWENLALIDLLCLK